MDSQIRITDRRKAEPEFWRSKARFNADASGTRMPSVAVEE